MVGILIGVAGIKFLALRGGGGGIMLRLVQCRVATIGIPIAIVDHPSFDHVKKIFTSATYSSLPSTSFSDLTF